MQWSRELRSAGRGLRTALRAAAAIAVPSHAPIGRGASRGAGQLIDMRDFGENPGRLAMLVYRPGAERTTGSPVVVLLHGCGQDAVEFAVHASWTALADRLGLTVVLPVQSADNNHHRCFQWFRPAQIGRGLGEAASIHQMVAAAVRQFDADPRRVYVVGLSAGAAMAVALLAAYPETFAAGASVAGLPVGAADGAAWALARMAQAGPERSPAMWADQARRAAPAGYADAWPRLSIWHGSADSVVDPANARLLATQWRALHGIGEQPASVFELPTARREAWGKPDRPAVELWTLPGVAHGYPVDGTGHVGAVTLAAGISATDQIARFWDLA
jgi:poly(hydroxyalkanoate) depolymerase family esterase